MVAHMLLVGLGNCPFPLTRHSVGHFIVDSLACRLGTRFAPTRGGFVANAIVHAGDFSIPLTLFKSKSLMNISGPSITAIYRKTVTSSKSLIVVADSLLHPVETLSVKLGGSANGHNGMKSIIAALGSDTDFYRFRVGIGRNETEAAEYVMSKISPHERQFWANEGLDLIIAELENVVRKGSL